MIGIGGDKTVLKAMSAQRTLIYVLSPSCGWCTRNYDNIVALGRHAAANYRVVGLSNSGSIDDLRKYLQKRPLPFEVFLIDRDLAGSLPLLDATPLTLTVEPSGQISQAWMGAFADSRQTKIEAEFGLKLPGLVAVPVQVPSNQ